jgi:outer membrane protein assembly factor BamB
VRPGYRFVGWLMRPALGLLAFAAGCQTVSKPPTIVEAPAGSFIQKWAADLPQIKNDPIVALYLRGDTLYAYARSNQVYGLSASGGKLIFADTIVPPTAPLRSPTLLPDNKVVFPSADTLEVYDRNGRRLRSLPLNKPTHSGGVAVGYTFYVGLDSPTGGRIAALDLTPRVPTEEQVKEAKRLNVSLEDEINRLSTKWEVLTISGIQSTPTFYQGVVYVATLDGEVFAINEGGAGIWSLPNGDHVFRADGPIKADLKADDLGLYVASEDGNLYCVDRGSGRIRWTYYAGAALDAAPVLTPTMLYQFVPGSGLVAIDRHPLGTAKAKWINPDAVEVLSEDEHNLYAVDKDGYLVALDKTDGHRLFRGVRRDMTVFATSETLGKSPQIYATASDGSLFAVGPVLRPGVMGLLVMNSIPTPFQQWLE